ncbi:alpha/beta fold hydrolase [Celerinatantimonas sp. MCCC 1A17872]|uniref:alpha/beta fold hydrolase n=1 Tax=Celerinatantimonas sp. MCCC 1A17872 TaxID=3177514 RepID=UPI0038C10FAF
MYQFTHKLNTSFPHKGGQIYYERLGDPSDPAIIFLHGGFVDMEVFNPLLALLGENYQFIGIDSRAHGRSTLGDVSLNYQQLQEDVEALLTHLGINHCNLIGFSDGGIVGYRLAALSHAIHIDRLVTIGSRWHIRNTDANKEQWLATTEQMRKTAQPQVYNRYQALNPEPDFAKLLTELTQMWLDESNHGHPNDAITQIKCPVLACHGDDDPIVSFDVLYQLTQRLSQAHLLNVPFAKHAAFVEQPLVFAQIINQFLAK